MQIRITRKDLIESAKYKKIEDINLFTDTHLDQLSITRASKIEFVDVRVLKQRKSSDASL